MAQSHIEFFQDSVVDANASREAGRTIYKDADFARVRYPHDPRTVLVKPAHEPTKVKGPDGMMVSTTYAAMYPHEFRAYREGVEYTGTGTPLTELPFLTAAQRKTLNGMGVYTAENLETLEGSALRQLGMNGRDLKDQAKAFLEVANNVADRRNKDRLEAEIADLRAMLEEMKASNGNANVADEAEAPRADGDEFDAMSEAELKDVIEQITDKRPQGNPNRETLLRKAREAFADIDNNPDDNGGGEA